MDQNFRVRVDPLDEGNHLAVELAAKVVAHERRREMRSSPMIPEDLEHVRWGFVLEAEIGGVLRRYVQHV